MTIFVAFHKKYPLLTNDEAYLPIHVGKVNSKYDLGICGDDSGDNISLKNKYFSELTGLYWIWKNTNTEVVGLNHYRRFFLGKKPPLKLQILKTIEFFGGQWKKRYGTYYTSNRKNSELIISGEEIDQLLQKYDVIIPIGPKLRYSSREHYSRRHFIKDLEETEKIVAELYPSYSDVFTLVMNKRTLTTCNMFIMSRHLFNDYMKWLFDIIFELESRSDLSDYNPYQIRLYGFISERLFDVWLIKNKFNTVSLPVLYFKNLKV